MHSELGVGLLSDLILLTPADVNRLGMKCVEERRFLRELDLLRHELDPLSHELDALNCGRSRQAYKFQPFDASIKDMRGAVRLLAESIYRESEMQVMCRLLLFRAELAKLHCSINMTPQCQGGRSCT